MREPSGRRLEAIAHKLEAIAIIGWRLSLISWRPSLVGWRSRFFGVPYRPTKRASSAEQLLHVLEMHLQTEFSEVEGELWNRNSSDTWCQSVQYYVYDLLSAIDRVFDTMVGNPFGTHAARLVFEPTMDRKVWFSCVAHSKETSLAHPLVSRL